MQDKINSNIYGKDLSKRVPYARRSVIGNKQDLKDSMSVTEIENLLGLKTYPMVANKSENRDKMIRIITEILDIDYDSSPLLSDIAGKKAETFPKPLINEQYFEQKTIPENKVQEVVKEKANNVINLSLALDLCEEVINEIKGLKFDIRFKNHYKMISSTLKRLSKNGEDFSFQDFYDKYQDYLNNNLKCSNLALKRFLKSEYTQLKKSIENEPSYFSNSIEEKNSVINALNCAFLTYINPDEFPDFDAILDSFKLKEYDSRMINKIHSYYLRIINRIKP
ncbi:MAG: hypothetical protein GF353_25385 [Candidatus Lokiarchaeota archaeon]|nr:hypothetical protein [Candidatus Lokiarchaeota archaeon]